MTPPNSPRPTASQRVPDTLPVCASPSSIGDAHWTQTDHTPSASRDALDEPSIDPTDDAAFALVRTALVCRLAVKLDDQALARRAAREAVAHARLLAARVVPTAGEVELHAAVVDPGSTLDELLRRAYPPASHLDVDDDQGEPDDDDQADDHDGGAAA